MVGPFTGIYDSSSRPTLAVLENAIGSKFGVFTRVIEVIGSDHMTVALGDGDPFRSLVGIEDPRVLVTGIIASCHPWT